MYLSCIHWCFTQLKIYIVELWDNLMKTELERFLKEAVVALFLYYAGILLGGLYEFEYLNPTSLE
jgi:hypothetical protein